MVVLICGASGMVGTALRQVLDTQGVEYIATWNTRPIEGGVQMKLTDMDHIGHMMVMFDKLEHKYGKITQCVYLAAIKSVEQCENDWELTRRVNIAGPAWMAKICEDNGVRFIFLSSDYVFDGDHSPYEPNDSPCPYQNYGMSKMIAELHVRNALRKTSCVIVRTPTLYGPAHMLHESSITSGIKPMMNFTGLTPVRYPIDNYFIRRPVYLPDLAKYLYNVICDTSMGGIYHYGNTKWRSTKYEMAYECAAYLGLDNCHDRMHQLQETYNLADRIRRPYDTLLHPEIHDQVSKFAETFPAMFDRLKLIIDKSTLVLLDLDGTLVDSHHAHCCAYYSCLPWVPPLDIKKHVVAGTMDKFLRSGTLTEEEIADIKRKKCDALQQQLRFIDFMPGAVELLTYLNENGITYCVVTNTTMHTVTGLKEHLPLLRDVPNWITRSNYPLPKPRPDCYQTAIHQHYADHKRIIAIEDSPVGIQAITSVTDSPVIILPILFGEETHERTNVFKETDCYWFKDHRTLLKLSSRM